MAEPRIKISDIEKAAALLSRYLRRLEEGLGRPDYCQQNLARLRQYFKTQGQGGQLLSPLERNGGGLVYFELPLGAREFHAQAAFLLLDCCRQEVAGRPDEALWAKWREFAQNIYYGAVEELYANTVSQEPTLILVFELAYRKLMSQAALAWWEGQDPGLRSIKRGIDRKFLLELSALIKPFRQQACQRAKVEAKVLERLVDQGYEPEFDVSKPQAEDLAAHLREAGLTPWLFQEMFVPLYLDQLKSQEEMLWETVRTASFSKPDELMATLSGRLPMVSDLALREIQKILARRAAEIEARASQELEELRRFSSRVKKQTQDQIAQNNQEMSRTVEVKLFSENLANLTARITDSLIQFQRNLTGQLWYLQDLERKEKNLQSIIERCQSLARMTPAELQNLITAKSGNIKSDLLEHLAQYQLLEAKVGSDWEAWTQAHARQLADLIKSARERCPARPAGPGAAGESDLKVLGHLIEESGGKRVYHVERLVEAYRRFIRERAEVIVNCGLLSDMIRLWPPLLMRTPTVIKQQELLDELRFLADSQRQSGRYYLLTAQGPVKPKINPAMVSPETSTQVRAFQKLVTVLVYDIRGSSFMSSKLHQAEKEREIKNKLGYLVAQAVRQHGGFLVKDTGDGGVAWFGDNASELYDKCYKDIITGKGLRLRHSIGTGAESPMLPAAEAAQQAASCSLAILKLAEKFIQDNFANYRDWFREAKEREILVEGMSYALLPPEFRALFKIGVGLASGDPGTDVVLALNAYGDYDLCGRLVNEASLYAGGRDPSHSMIQADQATILNLMLNSERFQFSYLQQLWQSRAEGVDAWEDKLREASGLSQSVLPDGCYHFPHLGLVIKRSGYYRPMQTVDNKEKSLVLTADDRECFWGGRAKLMDESGEEIKIIYEMQLEDTGQI